MVAVSNLGLLKLKCWWCGVATNKQMENSRVTVLECVFAKCFHKESWEKALQFLNHKASVICRFATGCRGIWGRRSLCGHGHSPRVVRQLCCGATRFIPRATVCMVECCAYEGVAVCCCEKGGSGSSLGVRGRPCHESMSLLLDVTRSRMWLIGLLLTRS